MDTFSLAKEAKIYNGEKTISSTSGAGKTDQLHVKEWLNHFLTPFLGNIFSVPLNFLWKCYSESNNEWSMSK